MGSSVAARALSATKRSPLDPLAHLRYAAKTMPATSSTIDDEVTAIRSNGYVVIHNLLAPDQLTGMRKALAPQLRVDLLGRNNFEGYRTERVYSLVGRGGLFEDLVEHPHVLALCDAFLEPNYLLTASQAINIHPGETPQPSACATASIIKFILSSIIKYKILY